jgi:hypothetical protein
MAPIKKKGMTDRATAKQAKAYIYGVKEMRKRAAVKKTNLYVAKYMYMADKPIDEQTYFILILIKIKSALPLLLRVTLFVLYLYMVWSFINT